MAASILWYDLETFGIHSRWDRIGQFAAIRTGPGFEEMGDPICLYCALPPDYVPDPDACMVTGLTPQQVNQVGLKEADFAREIHREMSVPATCVAGYNTIRFDDEFIRNLLYRNFYDPYRREYGDGNSRWDIIDLARMTHDLRPDGITWVYDNEGKPSFRLEELAPANGIEHDRAHDALSDVRATIGLATLIHDKRPRLFRYYYGLRKKEEVRKLLNLQSPRPLVHTSGMFTRPGGCTSLVFPVSAHPRQANVIITYDLRYDPSQWVGASVEEIRRRVFTRKEELDDEERVHLKGIHLNRSPAVSPLGTISSQRAQELDIDVRQCMRHAEFLSDRADLVQKIREVYAAGPESQEGPRDPDLQLYSGDFFGDEDRETFKKIHETDAAELVASPPRFVDPRGPELLRRFLARNYYDLLPPEEQKRWISHCASRLLAPELDDVLDYGRFRRKVLNLLSRTDTPARDKPILRELLSYADWVDEHVLRYG